MVDRCPTCGLALAGEEGHRAGGYMFNIAIAELVFLVILVTVLTLTWPSPPWDVLTYGSAAAMVALPIVLYPFTQSLFIGIDLLIHRTDSDFRPTETE